jgi:single-strand DNA-binding protein
MGRLCSDVTSREVGEKKTKVSTFRLAVNNPMNDKDTLFIKVQTWGKQAENVEKYLSKGSRILVDGSLRDDSWTNDKDEKVQAYVVNANNIQFVDSKSDSKSDDDKSSKSDDSKSQPSDDVSDDIPF